VLLLGEIRTCLLQNSRAVPRSSVDTLLRLRLGERVRLSERPISQGISPQTVTGVDCQLANASGARCRGVGTVGARAVLTSGHVLQGSAYVTVNRGDHDHRLPWSRYLAEPAVLQTIGKYNPVDLAEGFLAAVSAVSATGTLDLGAVTERLIASVQRNSLLDDRPPILTRRTHLRWAARIDPGNTRASADLVVVDDKVRTMHLMLPVSDLAEVIGYCEDVAFHDWALSTLARLIEKTPVESVGKLRPAADHLLQLWMPCAHVGSSMVPMWESLDRRSGFTRHWERLATHVRDRLMSAVVAARNP
jgi:hypothetical protein